QHGAPEQSRASTCCQGAILPPLPVGLSCERTQQSLAGHGRWWLRRGKDVRRPDEFKDRTALRLDDHRPRRPRPRPNVRLRTTAYVAEQWGRRWITIDTSRVALALARARIMG